MQSSEARTTYFRSLGVGDLALLVIHLRSQRLVTRNDHGGILPYFVCFFGYICRLETPSTICSISFPRRTDVGNCFIDAGAEMGRNLRNDLFFDSVREHWKYGCGSTHRKVSEPGIDINVGES